LEEGRGKEGVRVRISKEGRVKEEEGLRKREGGYENEEKGGGKGKEVK
jgi:hypothetical protein